jgi:hypothetical protein
VGEEGAPLLVPGGGALADAVGEMLVDPIRHQELGICGPTVEPLGVSDLFLSQWFAVCFGAVLLVRRAIADMALYNDQRWPAGFLRGKARCRLRTGQKMEGPAMIMMTQAQFLELVEELQGTATAAPTVKVRDALPRMAERYGERTVDAGRLFVRIACAAG